MSQCDNCCFSLNSMCITACRACQKNGFRAGEPCGLCLMGWAHRGRSRKLSNRHQVQGEGTAVPVLTSDALKAQSHVAENSRSEAPHPSPNACPIRVSHSHCPPPVTPKASPSNERAARSVLSLCHFSYSSRPDSPFSFDDGFFQMNIRSRKYTLWGKKTIVFIITINTN